MYTQKYDTHTYKTFTESLLTVCRYCSKCFTCIIQCNPHHFTDMSTDVTEPGSGNTPVLSVFLTSSWWRWWYGWFVGVLVLITTGTINEREREKGGGRKEEGRGKRRREEGKGWGRRRRLFLLPIFSCQCGTGKKKTCGSFVLRVSMVAHFRWRISFLESG